MNPGGQPEDLDLHFHSKIIGFFCTNLEFVDLSRENIREWEKPTEGRSK
jgi:hypothetical protein